MLRTIIVEYSVIKEIQVEIKDYELSFSGINDLVADKVDDVLPSDFDNHSWDWQGAEPKAKESAPQPPEDCYFESPMGKFATNGCFLIAHGFPIPDSFCDGNRYWIDGSKIVSLSIFDQMPEVDQLVEHQGIFSVSYEWLKHLPGLKVLSLKGDLESPGYLYLNGEFKGVLMPKRPPTLVTGGDDPSDVFRFYLGGATIDD